MKNILRKPGITNNILENNFLVNKQQSKESTDEERNTSKKPFLLETVKPLIVDIDTTKKNKVVVKKKKKNIFSRIVENNYFVGFMTLLTIIALFSNDVQMAWLQADIDLVFDILQTIMLVFFVFEIIITCLAKKSYINSFFFWLDIIATLSLIQDISFIFNPLINSAYGYCILLI